VKVPINVPICSPGDESSGVSFPIPPICNQDTDNGSNSAPSAIRAPSQVHFAHREQGGCCSDSWRSRLAERPLSHGGFSIRDVGLSGTEAVFSLISQG
jgi:hypothetical protein